MEKYIRNSQTIEYDPMCDKEKPQKISFEDVSAAAFRIHSHIIKTPCVKSHMSTTFGMDIYLKNDFLQHTGSFKERGARNALLLLSKDNKTRGVISASLGNHSQALSYHANNLNIPVTVVMPNVAPIMKIQKCRSYGANVIVQGHDMKEAKYHAMSLAKERSLIYINGYDHPHIMAGQGTVGLEIIEQVPDVDAVIVPVGGGGLLAGVATAIKHLKPHVLIYGAETEKCPSMEYAMKHDEPSSVEIKSTLADGLAVPTVGYNAFATVKHIVDRLITVNEDWIARAILHLIEQEKYVVEGGGAIGVAAIMAGLVPELAGKKVVCILSGGNIDTTILGRCLERGLAAEQRLVKFKVTVSDRPGGIAELCKLISSTGVSIKDIIQERAWVHGDIFSVRVKVVCETRGPEHLEELRAVIANTYREWDFAGEYDNFARRNSTESLDDVSH
ncbi:L-threonine ammonia-lyase-like isoform X3 [Helicoverpa zea]|uniref:L-threonine ammonia-lyase-like isoform X3 n=1 Tax=Helicoverpa zea TaxID=7113 RepID=UPI001F598E04|nr:L-threonine ammonia-lyase-like isoform X3 [Helicoverpa zea]